MKKLAKLLTVIGAAVVLLFGTAPAAMAGTDAHAQVCDSAACPAATVYFHSYGDWFRVCDTVVDGYSAVNDFYRPSGDHIQDWNDLGGGYCADFDYNFSEGYTVQFRACIGKSSTRVLIACSLWAYGVS